jgi:hypothetical protein
VTTHPILLRVTWLLVGRRASGFVLVGQGGLSGLKRLRSRISPAGLIFWRETIESEGRVTMWGHPNAVSAGVTLSHSTGRNAMIGYLVAFAFLCFATAASAQTPDTVFIEKLT